ncbi:meiotically upregulated Mug174 [Schizosaccharomyces japonicus yFS275]|uniref:Meiotically upregulated Mug174 n=1 Tax=Schizosaccharomyces japonicus (strain yFS275 / FY16936) TaxID=402676 RepID=B6JYU1_SCHJY|nr:meiotically upregulated Mug174 [Schizosaccharomyces japonicus yFS275]EEB06709.1 meiotically upregulated Mug174 [Schizosaccharomyces japonicus yFS275]
MLLRVRLKSPLIPVNIWVNTKEFSKDEKCLTTSDFVKQFLKFVFQSNDVRTAFEKQPCDEFVRGRVCYFQVVKETFAIPAHSGLRYFLDDGDCIEIGTFSQYETLPKGLHVIVLEDLNVQERNLFFQKMWPDMLSQSLQASVSLLSRKKQKRDSGVDSESSDSDASSDSSSSSTSTTLSTSSASSSTSSTSSATSDESSDSDSSPSEYNSTTVSSVEKTESSISNVKPPGTGSAATRARNERRKKKRLLKRLSMQEQVLTETTEPQMSTASNEYNEELSANPEPSITLSPTSLTPSTLVTPVPESIPLTQKYPPGSLLRFTVMDMDPKTYTPQLVQKSGRVIQADESQVKFQLTIDSRYKIEYDEYGEIIRGRFGDIPDEELVEGIATYEWSVLSDIEKIH